MTTQTTTGVASDDRSVLERAAAGDSDTFAEVVEQYGNLVWMLARQSRVPAADLEDAVQEVLVKLWRNADRFDRSIASERTFVAMIARRCLIDQQRRRLRMPKADALGDVDVAVPAAEPDRLGHREEVERVRAALGEFHGDVRRVLTLALFGGHTYQAIASWIGLPLGTVKSHARRGLIRLRERLGVPAGAAV